MGVVEAVPPLATPFPSDDEMGPSCEPVSWGQSDEIWAGLLFFSAIGRWTLSSSLGRCQCR